MRIAVGLVALAAGVASAAGAETGLKRVDCRFAIPAGRVADCYQLTVPEKHDGGSARTIVLPVAVLKSKSELRHDDPIVYLTGGPGSAVGLFPDEMAGWWPYFDAVPWLAGRDLVLMDQRGSGLSEPVLDCPEIEQVGLRLLQQSPDEAGRRTTYLAASEACRERLAATGIDLGAFDSAATAADFVALVAGLGLKSWNIYSVSYGTRLALTIARGDPAGLRAVILDSAYPPEEHFFERRRLAIEQGLAALRIACTARQDCANEFPDIAKTIVAAVERLEATPLMAKLEQDGKSEPVAFTGELLLEEILDMLNNRDAMIEIPVLLRGLAAGEIAAAEGAVADLAATYIGANRFAEGKYFAVDCEEEVPFTDTGRLAADIEAHEAFDDYGIVTDDWAACQAWIGADAAANDKSPVESTVPALVLQGGFDTLTPPESGRRAASRLVNGHYREFAEVGHKTVDQSVCAQKIAALFFAAPGQPPNDPCIRAAPVRPAF